jgi:hypothetical protein
MGLFYSSFPLFRGFSSIWSRIRRHKNTGSHRLDGGGTAPSFVIPGRNTIHAGHPFNSGSSHFLDSQVSFFIYILFILEVIDGGSVLPGNIAEEEMLFRTLFNPVWDSGPKEMKLFSISLYAPERVLCTLAASLSASELHEARLAASACEPYCRFFFCLMICNFLGQ